MKYATTILLATLSAILIPASAMQAADGEREGERRVERDRPREGEGQPRREVDREHRREGEGQRRREGEGDRPREGERDRRREGEGDRRREGEGDRRREGDVDRRRDGEGERRPAEGRGEMAQLRRVLENIVARLGRMERELAELRRVNAQLRSQLGRTARGGEGARRGEADGHIRREGEGDRRREGEGDRPREGERDRRREGQGDRRREGERDRPREGEGDRRREGERDRPREGEGDRKREGQGDRPRERAAGLPSGVEGFKGILEGSVVRKGERGFVLKVTRINKTWPQNRARNPRAAVGKEVEIIIQADRAVSERWIQLTREHFKVLGALKAGDRVAVEAFHFGGGNLTVVEGLKKLS